MAKVNTPRRTKIGQTKYRTKLKGFGVDKPEVSSALNSLLDEIRASDDAKVMHTATAGFRRTRLVKPPPRKELRSTCQRKFCLLCKQAGHPDINHFLSECRHLSEKTANILRKPAESPTSLTIILRKVTSQRRSQVTTRSVALSMAQNLQFSVYRHASPPSLTCSTPITLCVLPWTAVLPASLFAIFSSHAWEATLAAAHNLHTKQTGAPHLWLLEKLVCH